MLQFFPNSDADGVTDAGGRGSESATWESSLPLRLETWLGVTESESAFGPLLYLQTSLVLSSLRARVSLTDGRRPRLTHEASLIVGAQRLTPPRQMVRASFRHPELALQVRDLDGQALTDQALVGPCANGLREADAAFEGEVGIALRLERRSFGGGRSRLLLGGEMTFPRGAALSLEFQAPQAGREPARRSGTDVVVLPAGHTMRFRDHMIGTEGTGDSVVSVLLVDSRGLAIGEQRSMGRLLPD